MKCKFLTLSCFMLFINSYLSAQNNQFQFSHLNINNGLSHNEVTCILKDRKGFMWFGTLSGLNRYDGYKFRIFKHVLNDTTTLDDDYIVSITEGPGNKLWIKTRNGFNIYDPETDKFSHNIRPFLQSVSIADEFINDIKKDREGNFWFLDATLGIYKYDPSTHKTIHLIHSANTTSINANTIADIAEDSKGNLTMIGRFL